MISQDLYQQGLEHEAEGNFQDAITLFGRAIDRFTNSLDKAEAYFHLALAQNAAGNSNFALEAYTQAIAHYADNPDKAHTYINRGHVNFQQGKVEDAITDYTHAIELHKKNNDKARAYYFRGFTKIKQGNRDGAIMDLNQSIKLSKDNDEKASAYHRRGIIFYGQEKFDAAFADFNKVITLLVENSSSNKVKSYEYRGAARHMLHQYSGALADFDSARTLFVDNSGKARCHYNHALTNYALGRFESTCTDATHAISLFTDNPHDQALAYRLRGIAYEKQGLYSEAVTNFNSAIEKFTKKNDKADTYLFRGMIHFNQGFFADAMTDFNTAITLFDTEKDKAYASHHLSITYEKQQPNLTAKAHLLKAWQSLETQQGLRLYIGMHLKKLTANDGTDFTIELAPQIKALAKNPNNRRDTRCILTVVSAYEKQFDIAKTQCKELFKQFPPTLIPRYLRDEFFEMLVNNTMRPSQPFSKEDVFDSHEIKKQLADLIMELNDNKLRQAALCQTLIASTFLGHIFDIPRGLLGKKPSPGSSENKQRVICCLENEITRHGLLLDDITKQELNEEIGAFLQSKNSRTKYPNLYSELIELTPSQNTAANKSAAQPTRFFYRRTKTAAHVQTELALPLKELFQEEDKKPLLHDAQDPLQLAEYCL